MGGCYKCQDYYYKIDINRMDISVVHTYWQETIPEKFPVAFDSTVIKATFSGPTIGGSATQNTFGFLPAALARDDCYSVSKGSDETIQNVTVIALTDFNQTFKTYDTLNAIIEAAKDFSSGYAFQGAAFKALNQYLTEMPPGIFSDNGQRGGLFLRLKEKPTQKIIKLRVEVALTNGENYSGETIPITLKP